MARICRWFFTQKGYLESEGKDDKADLSMKDKGDILQGYRCLEVFSLILDG